MTGKPTIFADDNQVRLGSQLKSHALPLSPTSSSPYYAGAFVPNALNEDYGEGAWFMNGSSLNISIESLSQRMMPRPTCAQNGRREDWISG